MKKIILRFDQQSRPPFTVEANGSYNFLKQKYAPGTVIRVDNRGFHKIASVEIEPLTDFWPKNSHAPQKAYKGKLTYLILKNMVESFDFVRLLNENSHTGFFMAYWNDFTQKIEVFHNSFDKPPKFDSCRIIQLGLIHKPEPYINKRDYIISNFKPNIISRKELIKRYHTEEYPV